MRGMTVKKNDGSQTYQSQAQHKEHMRIPAEGPEKHWQEKSHGQQHLGWPRKVRALLEDVEHRDPARRGQHEQGTGNALRKNERMPLEEVGAQAQAQEETQGRDAEESAPKQTRYCQTEQGPTNHGKDPLKNSDTVLIVGENLVEQGDRHRFGARPKSRIVKG